MQSVSSRIWTRIAVFISYGDNDYTTVGVRKAVVSRAVAFRICSIYLETFLYSSRQFFGRILLLRKKNNVKIACLIIKRNPTNANIQKLTKVKREQISAYQKEQIEYIQGQINKTGNSVEDRQFRLMWHNESKEEHL